MTFQKKSKRFNVYFACLSNEFLSPPPRPEKSKLPPDQTNSRKGNVNTTENPLKITAKSVCLEALQLV